MRIPVLLCFILMVIGCNSEKAPGKANTNKPDSLLSEFRMIHILADVHKTEAAIAYLRNHGKDNKEINREYYTLLFSKHKISKKRFEQNLAFYQSDQENFLKMYEQVLVQLTPPPVKAKKEGSKKKEAIKKK